MSFRESARALSSQTAGLRPVWQRLLPLALAVSLLLILGFYTVTTQAHLHDSLLLNGADWAGYALCHRITERSFSIAGRQFPLCARCSGMYLGVALVSIVTILARREHHVLLPSRKLMLVLVGFIALMGVDGLNSYSHFFPQAPHLYEPQNWLRTLTGMGTGLAMGIILWPALAQTLWRWPEGRPVLGSSRELMALLFPALILVLLILSNQATLLYVLALGSVAGLLFIVAALNTVILLVLFRQDGRASGWAQALVPLTVGFLIALVELSIIAYLRFELTGTMTGFPGL